MKRLKIIVIALAVMILALTLRLAYIQVLGHEDLSAATRAQSLIALEGSNTRGIIYDRYGQPLVADEKQYIYIIKNENFNERAKQLLRKMDAGPVSSDNEGHQVYSSHRYDKKVGRKLIEDNGAYILQASARYGDRQTAPHLIGYVNKKDSSGAAGLELMYDDRLSGLNRRVYAAADVKGNILPGRGLIIASDGNNDSYVTEGIRTTIDKELQEEVEEIIGEEDNNCAVVVLDTSTGGVAAMACTPTFDPNDVTEHIKKGKDELINKVTQGEYPPGSVFKIVVAAAALENGVDIDKSYTCSGHVELDGITIGCLTGGEEGHGEISFKNAFAESCNSFFIRLGQEVGADKIVEMAEEMGLGGKVLEGYPQEGSGHVMTEEEYIGNGVGNLCIGQGEMLTTPLQNAAMTNIIANGGVDKGIHLLMDEEQDDRKVISSETADELREMMGLTVMQGTGRILGIDDEGEPVAAVKTGTAQYGETGDETSHGWITGFTPYKEPEYVITVLVEGGSSGNGTAGPIMRKIIEYLEESGSYSRPTLA
ncbi:MAG: penicillin-binding protein 2 [Bacillota bacterium]|nr:penicillin-binding protein 2 [Bacillota bacterium]